jgi:hypothetical protein
MITQEEIDIFKKHPATIARQNKYVIVTLQGNVDTDDAQWLYHHGWSSTWMNKLSATEVWYREIV